MIKSYLLFIIWKFNNLLFLFYNYIFYVVFCNRKFQKHVKISVIYLLDGIRFGAEI